MGSGVRVSRSATGGVQEVAFFQPPPLRGMMAAEAKSSRFLLRPSRRCPGGSAPASRRALRARHARCHHEEASTINNNSAVRLFSICPESIENATSVLPAPSLRPTNLKRQREMPSCANRSGRRVWEVETATCSI